MNPISKYTPAEAKAHLEQVLGVMLANTIKEGKRLELHGKISGIRLDTSAPDLHYQYLGE